MPKNDPPVGSVWITADPAMCRKVAMVGVDGSNRPIVLYWRGQETERRHCALHAWHRWVRDNKATKAVG